VALTKIAAFRGGKPGDRVTTHDGLFTQRPLQLDWKHYVFVTDSKWEGSDDTLKRIVSTVVGVQIQQIFYLVISRSVFLKTQLKGESIKNRRN
jgi:hypothetical protein